MRHLHILLLLLYPVCSLAQDGSDILYIPVSKLNGSYTGKYVHLDFYRISHGVNSRDKKRKNTTTDTVVINIGNNPITFTEHREDDGFNNWFFQQYLFARDTAKNQTIRITKFRLDNVTPDSIRVTSFINYYDTKNEPLPALSQQQHTFSRKIISQILVSSRME
ncbi:MAG: hypothetical protein QM731_01830 [Chitinophagaceae bacterium]